MANLTRRQWLKVGLAVGGMVTFGLSYRDVAKRAIDGLLNGTSGKVTRDRPLAGCRPRHSPHGGRATCLNGSILYCGSKTAPSARLRRPGDNRSAGQYFSTEPGGRLLSARSR